MLYYMTSTSMERAAESNTKCILFPNSKQKGFQLWSFVIFLLFGSLLQLAICPAKLLCSVKAIALPFTTKPVLYILFIVSIIHNYCRVWNVEWKYLFNILNPQQSYSPRCSYSTLSSHEIIPWLFCWCGAFLYWASLHWCRGLYL